jgi:hypothetical protein
VGCNKNDIPNILCEVILARERREIPAGCWVEALISTFAICADTFDLTSTRLLIGFVYCIKDTRAEFESDHALRKVRETFFK